MANKIEASIIIEIMGRPKEHLQSAAEDLLVTLGKEKGIRITSKVLHELKKVENKDETGKIIEVSEDRQLYSTFAEVELEADDILTFAAMSFKYLPSHIEIVEPENFVLNNFDLSAIFNEIVSKLHNYDAIAKSAIMQNQMLAQKFMEMQKNAGKHIEVQENSEKKEKPKKTK